MLVMGRGNAPLVDPDFEGDPANSARMVVFRVHCLVEPRRYISSSGGMRRFFDARRERDIYMYLYRHPWNRRVQTEIVTVIFTRCLLMHGDDQLVDSIVG